MNVPRKSVVIVVFSSGNSLNKKYAVWLCKVNVKKRTYDNLNLKKKKASNLFLIKSLFLLSV